MNVCPLPSFISLSDFSFSGIEPQDVGYLIEEVKTGTELNRIVNDSLTLVTKHPELRPSAETNFNIWPFVTHAIFTQLQFRIPIDVRRHSADYF